MLPHSCARLAPFPSSPHRAAPHRRLLLRGLAQLAAFLAAVAFAPAVSAQSYLYWDLNGFTAGAGGGTTPTGIWNTTDTRWNALAAGNGPVVPWINNSVAVFSAGSNATGAYSIALATANLATGGLHFEDGTVALTGAGTIALVNPTAGVTPQVSLGGQPASIGAGVTLAGSAGLNFVGSGTLTLAGATTTTGATMIDGVTVRLAAANRLSDASPLQLLGELDLAGFDETVGTLSGNGTVVLGDGRLTISNTADSTFAGTINGTGSVWKSGAGRLTLTQPAGWTGETRIQAGTLALGASGVFPATADITVEAGAIFDVGARTDWIGGLSGGGTVAIAGGQFGAGGAGDSTFTGTVTGTGTFWKQGTGTLTLAKQSPFTGTVTVDNGTLRLGTDDALNAARISVVSPGTLDLDGNALQPASFDGAGTVRLGGGRLTLRNIDPWRANFVGPGTLVKTGTGWTRLFGAIGAGTTLELQEGEMSVFDPALLGAGRDARVAAGAKLTFGSGAFTLGTLEAAGTVHLGTADLTLAGPGDSNITGVIDEFGGLTKSGPGILTLSGTATYTGATSVLGGTLRLVGTQRLPSGATALVGPGATLELAGAPPGDYQLFGAVTGTGDLRAAGATDTISLGEGNVTSTFAGQLRGAGRFRKAGTGTLTLSGASDATGDFTVFQGTVRLGADDTLPTRTSGVTDVGLGGRLELAGHTQHLHGLNQDGLIDLGGGVLILTGGAGFTGTIAGSGGLEKEGASTDILFGPLTFSGPTRVRAGTLRIDRSGVLDTDVQLDAGATLDTSGRVVAVDELTGTGTLVCPGGEFGVGASGANFSFGGAISGGDAARFAKNGTGRFTLTGTSGLSLEIRGGTLALGADERIDNLASVHVAAGQYFDVANRIETIDALTGPGKTALGTGRLTVGAGGGSFTLDGTVTDGARFTKTGAGELVLAGRIAGANSVLLQNGTLRLGGDDRFDATLDLAMNNGAIFDLGGFAQTLHEIEGFGEVRASPGSTLTLDPGALSTALAVNFTGPGRFVKRGAAALTWQGTSADALDVVVEAGGLRLGGSQRFASLTKITLGAGAWFESGAFAQDLRELAGPGELRLAAGGVVRVRQGVFDGTLTGPGAFEKIGATPLTLAQAQDFPGTLRTTSGTLNLGVGVWTFARTVVDPGSALALLSGSTLAGPVENDGTLMLGGGPAVALTGAVTGHGGFFGNVSLGGSFAPGSTADPYALVACSGSMKFSPTHTLTLQLGGYTPGISHDQVVCAGSVTFDGTLRIERHHGFAIVPGQPFQLFQAGGFSGTFATLDLPVLPPGYAWDPTRLTVDGTLRIVAGYEAWALGFGLNPATDGAPLANRSGDGVSNLLKYLFRGNPLLAQSDLAPVAAIEPNAGGATLVFSYRRDAFPALTLASVGVEWSTDLTNWAPVADGTGGTRITVTPIDTDLDLVTVRIPIGGPRGFARLRVEL